MKRNPLTRTEIQTKQDRKEWKKKLRKLTLGKWVWLFFVSGFWAQANSADTFMCVPAPNCHSFQVSRNTVIRNDNWSWPTRECEPLSHQVFILTWQLQSLCLTGCNANICNYTDKVLRFLFWSFVRLVGRLVSEYHFRGFIILYICCDN